jgi:hypothetical protein
MGPEGPDNIQIYFWEFAWQNPSIGFAAFLLALIAAQTVFMIGQCLVLALRKNKSQLYLGTLSNVAVFVGNIYCSFEWLVVWMGGS